MIQPTPSAADAGPVEPRSRPPLQVWEYVFLAALAASTLLAAFLQCQKEYLTNDELITGILAANPSFSEMMAAIRRGGELNPPLFFILEWAMVRIFGPTELALRALPGLGITLGSLVLFLTLRPVTGPRAAAVALALVMGLSHDVFIFAREARYYGVLFLLVAAGIFLLVRLATERSVRWRDCVLIFIVHAVLVYTHLYGLIYSGVLLVVMLAMEILGGRFRWRPLVAVLVAWASFGAWLPAMRQQLHSVSQGVYVPERFYKLGFLLDELALQTPLAPVLICVFLLAFLALFSHRPCPAATEATACAAPGGWAALGLVALALLCVPITTWLASHILQPPPFMRRYMFPTANAWVILLALLTAMLWRLPPANPPLKFRVTPALWSVAWLGVLAFGLAFKPALAASRPARPPAPFVDVDYGHPNLPLVFENSWYWVPRVFYGRDREYLLFIDRDAAEADPFWYTKAMQRFFQGWHPRYHRAKVAYYEELPPAFIAFDDDYTKTFDWVFEHHPELTKELLGQRPAERALHGQERIWLVRKPAGQRK